jgi:hypothetical protein
LVECCYYDDFSCGSIDHLKASHGEGELINRAPAKKMRKGGRPFVNQ